MYNTCTAYLHIFGYLILDILMCYSNSKNKLYINYQLDALIIIYS
jgi:hypothetical protein